MAIKICKKKDNKDIIKVNGVKYKRYKRSKDIFLEHQQEHLEDINRKHIAFLNDMHQEQLNEVEKFLEEE